MGISILIAAVFSGIKPLEPYGRHFMRWCCGPEYMLKVSRVSCTMWMMHFHLNLTRHLRFTHHMTVGTQRSKSGYSIYLMRSGFLMRRENRNLDANSPLLGCGSAWT